MTRNAVWCLSNLCRGKNPPPDFVKVSSQLGWSVWKACKGKDEVVERKEGVGFEAFFMGNRPSACSLCAAVVELNVLIVVMVCRWLGCISSG